MILLLSHRSSVKSVATNDSSPGGCREGEIPMDSCRLSSVLKSKSENNFSYKNKSKFQFIVLNKYRKEGYILKDKTVNDNVSRLAHLLNQKYMNISLYESKKIPAYMYEQVNEELCKKIDELEKACYTCT